MPAPLVSTEGVRFVQLPPVRTRGVDFATLLDEAGEPVDAGAPRGPAAGARRGAGGVPARRGRDRAVSLRPPRSRGRVPGSDRRRARADARARSSSPPCATSWSRRQSPSGSAETHRRLARLLRRRAGPRRSGPRAARGELAGGRRPSPAPPLHRLRRRGRSGRCRRPVEAAEAERARSSCPAAPAPRRCRCSARPRSRRPRHPGPALAPAGRTRGRAKRISRDLRAAAARQRGGRARATGFSQRFSPAPPCRSARRATTPSSISCAPGRATLLVPFEAGRETEQRLRAESLAARGLAGGSAGGGAVGGTALASAVFRAARVGAAAARCDGHQARWGSGRRSRSRGGDAEGGATGRSLRESRAAGPRPFHEAPLRPRRGRGHPSRPLVARRRRGRGDAGAGAAARLWRGATTCPLALAVIPHASGALARGPPRRGAGDGGAGPRARPTPTMPRPTTRRPSSGPIARSQVMAAELAARPAANAPPPSAGRALPVLVPPWNRIAPALMPTLPDSRLRGPLDLRATARPTSPRPASSRSTPTSTRSTGAARRGLAGSRTRLEADLAGAIEARVDRRRPTSRSGSSPITSSTTRRSGPSASGFWSGCPARRASAIPLSANYSRADSLPPVTEP